MTGPRKRKTTYVADEDDDATWTSWKFCTGDRIRELLNGEPASNPELRALGLVETFSRTYSRPVLKTVMEFARAFNEVDDWCMFRGTKIQYGKEEMRRVFSLPSGPFSEVSDSWNGLEVLNMWNKEKPRGKPTGQLSIDSLKGSFKSWRGPVRAVQELLLGKRYPSQVNAKLMWYFHAHLSDSVEPAELKPDWADLVCNVLQGQIETLKKHLMKTPKEARGRVWRRQRCPVFCGTALMAILIDHGFSEEELSCDFEEHPKVLKWLAEGTNQGLATTASDVQRDCGEPAAVETGRKPKRRRIVTQVDKQTRDSVERVRATKIAREMAKRKKEGSRRKGSTGSKRNLEACNLIAMKMVRPRYKQRRSSWPEMVGYGGLANTQGEGESIEHEQKKHDTQPREKMNERAEFRVQLLKAQEQVADYSRKLLQSQVEKMNEDARFQTELMKAQEHFGENFKKLLESQDQLHTEQMAKYMNEKARLKAGLQKAKGGLFSLEEKYKEQEKGHAEKIVEKEKEKASLQAELQLAEEVIVCLEEQRKNQDKLHADETEGKFIESARLQARLQKAEEESVDFKTKFLESQAKTREAHASSQGWQDTWEGVCKTLKQVKAENQNLSRRVGLLSTNTEMAEKMQKRLDDENEVLRQQLRLQSAMLAKNWDEGALENLNERSPCARLTSECNAASQRREPTSVLLPGNNALTAGPSRAQGTPRIIEANHRPKLEFPSQVLEPRVGLELERGVMIFGGPVKTGQD